MSLSHSQRVKNGTRTPCKSCLSFRLVSFWLALWLELPCAMSFKKVLDIKQSKIVKNAKIWGEIPLARACYHTKPLNNSATTSTSRSNAKRLAEYANPMNVTMCTTIPIAEARYCILVFSPVYKRMYKRPVWRRVAFALTIAKILIIMVVQTTR